MTILQGVALDSSTNIADLFDIVGGGSAIFPTFGRSGGNALAANGNRTGLIFPSLLSTVHVAFAWRQDGGSYGNADFLDFGDGTLHTLAVSTLSDGRIQVSRLDGITESRTLLDETGPGVLSIGRYPHIEVKLVVDGAAGSVDVWVNSINVLSVSGVNTDGGVHSGFVSNFTVRADTPTVAAGYYCDILVGDARIGDQRAYWSPVTGPGSHTDFTPSAGANWQNVDEVPPDGDTTYNETATVGAIDSFAHHALVSVPTSISAVIVQAIARNSATGVGSMATFLKSGGTDNVGASEAMDVVYARLQTIYDVDPATGVAWTVSGVNASEPGYKKTA